MAGTVLYCRSTVTRCSGWQGDLVMYFPPSTVAPGRAMREFFTLIWGALTSRRTYINVLITELYGIAGVVYMLLDVTFSCVIMWIYVCTRMCWRIET